MPQKAVNVMSADHKAESLYEDEEYSLYEDDEEEVKPKLDTKDKPNK